MIYLILFGSSEEELRRLEGDALTQYVAGSLQDAESKAIRDMIRFGWPYALIFTMNPEPVKLSLLSLEEEIMKAFARWF